MPMWVCPHINAILAAVNSSDELVAVREGAVVGSVKTNERPWHTSERCTSTEQVEEEAPNFVAQIAGDESTCA